MKISKSKDLPGSILAICLTLLPLKAKTFSPLVPEIEPLLRHHFPLNNSI
jgi:hypothetical protein